MAWNWGGTASGAASGAAAGSTFGPWGTVIGGVGGGLLGGLTGGKEDATVTYDPYAAFTPEQKKLYQALGPRLQALSTGDPELYSGQFNSDMTPEEVAAMKQEGRLAALNETYGNKFAPGQLNQEVEDTEFRNLQNQFYGSGNMPGVKALTEEQFAGNGGYWGDARAKGVMGAYQNTVADPYALGRSTRLQNSYNNYLNYVDKSSALNQTNANMQAVPRAIKDYNLLQRYNDWTRGQADRQKYVDDALNFLGISSGVEDTTPAPVGTDWMSLISDVSPLLQAFMKNKTTGTSGGFANTNHATVANNF